MKYLPIFLLFLTTLLTSAGCFALVGYVEVIKEPPPTKSPAVGLVILGLLLGFVSLVMGDWLTLTMREDSAGESDQKDK